MAIIKIKNMKLNINVECMNTIDNNSGNENLLSVL